MTRKLSSLFMCISVVVLVIGSCSAETPSAPGSPSADSSRPIFRTDPSARRSQPAQLAETNLSRTSSEQISGMELTLQRYRAGFENLSLPQVLQVWPGLDRHRQSALKDVFKYLRAHSATPKLGIECAPPATMGESVWVNCLETLSYTDGKGKTTDVKPAHVSILLRSQSGSWVMDTIQQRD